MVIEVKRKYRSILLLLVLVFVSEALKAQTVMPLTINQLENRFEKGGDTEGKNPDKINYVENAIDAIASWKTPEVTTTKAIGCTIKWKKEGA